MLIVFIGPPASGKGTQAKRVIAYLGIAHLSTGDLLREARQDGSPLGRQAAQYMDRGELVPDSLVIGLVNQKLHEPGFRRGALFDGFPRTIDQARALDESLSSLGTPLDLVLELQADEKVLKARMHKRALEESRVDDNPQTLSQRMTVYYEQTAPLLEYYRQQGKLATINAMGTTDEVFERIKKAINARRKGPSVAAGSAGAIKQ